MLKIADKWEVRGVPYYLFANGKWYWGEMPESGPFWDRPEAGIPLENRDPSYFRPLISRLEVLSIAR